MKVYISVDIEGVAGVSGGTQISEDKRDYSRMRHLMTMEANAAIEGAFAAGADYILVNDAHGPMTNILIEDLDTRAELISGRPKPLQMLAGLDSSFDAAVLVGYHARMGTYQGTVDHSYWGIVRDIRLNGKPYGESGMNALAASCFGVPVVAVSGDEALAGQVKEEIGDIETIVVKWGLGRYAARSLHPEKARELIRTAVARGVQRRAELRRPAPEPPFRFDITFANSGMADAAGIIPGVERDGLTLSYSCNKLLDGYSMMRALITLAGT